MQTPGSAPCRGGVVTRCSQKWVSMDTPDSLRLPLGDTHKEQLNRDLLAFLKS